MNKTPEEMAEELDRQAVLYVSLKARNDVSYYVGMDCYRAGYKAAQSRWIPVGEAMPKKRVDVLVKLRDKRNGDYWLAFDYAISKKSWSEKWEHSEAIAWMPLPEMEEWRDDK